MTRSFKISKFFLLVLLFFSSLSAQAAVYSHSLKSWSPESEAAYSKWIETKVETDWLKDPSNVFFNMPADCADLAYLLRIYFSYQHGLEFKIKNSRLEISSRTNAYDHIQDPQKRIRAFAEYILRQTSTLTLIEDTALVPIEKSAVRPGTLILADRKRRHAWVLKKISNEGIPELIYSSTTNLPEIFKSYFYPPFESAFPLGQNTLQNGGGIRRFRTPSEVGIPESQLEAQGLAQLKIPNHELFERLTEATRTKPTDPNTLLSYLLADLCSKVRERANVVTDAIHLQTKKQGKPFSASEFDLYSTPKRDSDIKKDFARILLTRDKYRKFLQPQILQRIDSLTSPQRNHQAFCLVSFAVHRQTGQDIVEPLGFILERFEKDLVSSDPNDSLARRWGF